MAQGEPPELSLHHRTAGTPPPCPSVDDRFIASILPTLRRMITYGYRIPSQDSEDVLQNALVDFLVQSGRRAVVTPGLLMVIVRRRCLDYWRAWSRKRREETVLDALPEEDSDNAISSGNEYAAGLFDGLRLARVWPSLSAACRRALARRFWRHQRTAELAHLWGYRPESLKRFISRCLARLRVEMERTS